MTTAFDLLSSAVIAVAILTFIKWGIDSSDRSREFIGLLRSHMRRTARRRRGFNEMSRDISPYVGLAALAAIPVLLLAFVAVALYQLGML